MKSALLVFTILLLTVPISAQPIAGTAAEKCTLEGQVVAAGTGAPLRKARVLLSKAEARGQPVLAVTDADGRFLFSDIEPGRYRLSAYRNGYVNQQFRELGPNRRGTMLALAPGQHLDDLVFKLVRQAVISGRVYDEEGEPVVRAQVMVSRYRYVDGERQLGGEGFGSTNDLGEYRVFGLAPGSYYVSATYQDNFSSFARFQRRGGGDAGRSGVQEGYVPTYYPGVNDPDRAAPLDLRAGDELSSVDFTLLPTRTVSVRGRVVNSVSSEARSRMMVFLLPRGSGAGRNRLRKRAVVDDKDGTFEVRGVAPGSYVVSAIYFDGREQYGARQPVEVESSDVEGITLVIGPGVDVAGRVSVEGAAAAADPGPAGAGEQAGESLVMTNVHVALQGFERFPMIGSSSTARLKADGSFHIEKVLQARYNVNVFSLPRDYYLKSARVGGEDVLEEGLDLSLGPPSGPLEITISAAGGRIDGAVLTEEDKAFGGATVVLVPEGRRREESRYYKTTTTDQNGGFTLRGIPPGDYKLFAWEEIERGAYQDSAFLRRYEEQGELVEVEEGSRLSVRLKIIPSESGNR